MTGLKVYVPQLTSVTTQWSQWSPCRGFDALLCLWQRNSPFSWRHDAYRGQGRGAQSGWQPCCGNAVLHLYCDLDHFLSLAALKLVLLRFDLQKWSVSSDPAWGISSTRCSNRTYGGRGVLLVSLTCSLFSWSDHLNPKRLTLCTILHHAEYARSIMFWHPFLSYWDLLSSLRDP